MVIEWLGLSNLEFGVLDSSHGDRMAPLDLARRDEPLASIRHKNKQRIGTAGIESLDHPAPALIPARRRKLHGEMASSPVSTGRCFDLDPQEPASELGDQVVVRAVEEREGDASPNPRQPLDRCRFAEISLLSRVKLRHVRNLGVPGSQLAPRLQHIRDVTVSRSMRSRIASLP
jgi:hypothetical protein